MSGNDPRAGIAFMVAATFVFSVQDALSRVLAMDYNVWMIVMIRYWVFAAFVILLAARRPGGLREVARTRRPWLQVLRSLTLALEIVAAIVSFSLVGLVEYHAIFVSAPLMVAALSGPVLGEQVGWRRWAAIAVGAVGVLIILRPGPGMFESAALLSLLSAALFAIYGLQTRYLGREDSSATSFFWAGTVGAVFMTCIGVWFWEPMSASGWGFMAGLSAAALLGHWLYIRCYTIAEASAVQPFAYFHLVFASIFGVVLFGDLLEMPVVAGAAIVVAAGLFTWWRERPRARGAAR